MADAALFDGAFGGRYQLTRHLEGGGGIETFVADDLRTGDRVVVKAAAAIQLGRAVRTRLEHEGEVLRQLESPFLTPVLEVGEDHGVVYVVFPYVDGVVWTLAWLAVRCRCRMP